MQKFNTLTGEAAYLPISNIDTDMIIPKQYLKTIKRSGLGKHLFAERRYDAEGNPISTFVLNAQPKSVILIAGQNFGCGSSREHAPWALLDFGIRAVIASSFADIFYNNCFKNGILPVVLPQEDINKLVDKTGDVTIDLQKQTVMHDGSAFRFEIESHRREILLEGLDDIERVMRMEDKIQAFEARHFAAQPWLKDSSHA
ncbi:MAG: 3-isopropylmalate dehydratase small subunit [Alphaproteobacteria bacterium]